MSVPRHILNTTRFIEFRSGPGTVKCEGKYLVQFLPSNGFYSSCRTKMNMGN